MGADFSGFRHGFTSSRPSKKDADNESCRLRASLMRFMKPRSLWAIMKIRKRQEKHELPLYMNNYKVLTLEDWIMSSPAGDHIDISGAGEETSHAPKQSSRKIHPSFDGVLREEISVNTDDGQSENTSFSRTTSGKGKKKVSFTSPEVTDIFMLDSPETNVSEIKSMQSFHREMLYLHTAI
ncbi:hypothetical protein Salat_0310100 [Sesamum alatum]|uniref:Uncharacterized protein n=1 Tax=Sesamum alatum TaxID=300844 RepID=A0AAE1Z0P9_9LAMI|nr:hypothetical protein Salat_0310100 [Sesamum alatum]